MKVFLDCIPCFLKQALEATRLATQETELQQKTMRVVLEKLAKESWDTSPPHIGRTVHRLVQEVTGNPDPYAPLKKQSNDTALRLYPIWEERIKKADDPFEVAVRLALAGNIIDFGARPGERIDLEKEIEAVMQSPLDKGALETFKQIVMSAKRILFLGDNAGEIVFDKFLLKQIGPEKITYVVKAKPIINDATIEDAKAVSLTEMVSVIDNGSDYPGTVLESCSKEFRKLYQEADLVVAKGQGNYETLSDAERSIVFLLKVKCPVIARDMGRKVGDLVIHLHRVYI